MRVGIVKTTVKIDIKKPTISRFLFVFTFYFEILAQVSRKPTVLLKIKASGS
jgi:hypothetical protein